MMSSSQFSPPHRSRQLAPANATTQPTCHEPTIHANSNEAPCVGVTIDDSDMGTFTAAVLSFWRNNCRKFPAWAKAARMVFAMSPNSASCERVFALLKSMFGEEQMSVLADYVSAALMLRYNKRAVG